MFDNSDTIEKVIDEIRNGKTLTNDRMLKFADDLLYNESSTNACRVFLALAEKKVFISDLIFDRLCNVIINNHQKTTKENSIRTIDIRLENGQYPSDLCLNALSIALQDQQSLLLRRYGSKILYNLIKNQSALRLNPLLLNAMSHALNDPLTTVQIYTLFSFEELVRNQRYDIPQESIDSMEALLLNIYQDINKNYGNCGLMTSFFLNLLYRQYKLNENLLEIFSELLIVEVVSHKDLSLNRSASYVLQKAIENQLFIGHLTPKILNNISICFNLMSSQHKEMLEYCLRILCALNEDQLMSTQLDTHLLKHYLKDTNLDERLRSYVTILLGNLCKISYQNIDISIVEDTIDVLIEGLDHEKLLQSSIYALKNIAQYKQDYLSIFPLRKFVAILNRNDLNKEIRQNVCLILVSAIQNQQPLTKYEIDGLENALNDPDTSNTTLFLLLLRCVQNGQKLANHLIETFTIQLCINKNIEKIEIFIQILYYIVHNGQSLTNTMIQRFNDYFLKNQFCSKYTIQIFKLLTSRNEIRINAKIYDKLANLLKSQNDDNIQTNLIETLAYSLQNLTHDDELPNRRIVTLIEDYFQNNPTKEIKYYSCLALKSLIAHQINLSDFTLDLLKIYAQDDELDNTQMTTSYSSTINLRDISLDTLKQYVTMYQGFANTVHMQTIEQIIKCEMLGQTILESQNPRNRLAAGKQLLSIVQDGQRSLSTCNMKVLELSFHSNDSSIEFKSIVMKIFECVAAYLNQSQISFILSSIHDDILSEAVINVLKALIHFRKSFPIKTLDILIDFASENRNQTLRDSVIDSLETITNYETIPPEILKKIQFPIFSKCLQNPTCNVQNKKAAIDKCLELVRDGYKISRNTIESLEYLLKSSFDMHDIKENALHIIEIAVRNGQKLPSTFLNLLSRLINNDRFNRRYLIEIIKLISNHNEELITQEILDNSEQYLLENLNESYPIFLRGTQNGCKLTKPTTQHFAKILENQENTTLNQRLNIVEILKNLATNTKTFDENLIRCLENALNEHDETMQKKILNTLKYIPNYKPSTKFFIYLENILKGHPLLSQIENILEKCLKIPIQFTLHIIHVFLIVEYVDANIYNKELDLICRELLCTDLLLRIYQHDKYDSITQNCDIKDNKELNDSIENLEENYRKIMLAYDHDSKFYPIGKPINHWNECDVGKWSAYYKQNSNQNSEQSRYELICVVKRAIFLHNTKQQFEPRATQILSLLLMLNASEANIARLAQIKTGEGKSVIIAMFAAIKALNGNKVDIVTTSPLLAKRDAENKNRFYTMLNLTVAENSGMSSTKPCYTNDIVYGSVNDFQFDILKDEYSLLGTRCQRKFDIAIVDEVDSMLIDDNSKICRLSSKIPAIDELKVVLTVLWQELNRTYDKIIQIKDKLYCVTIPFRMDENGKIILLKSETTNENDKTTAAADDDDDDDDMHDLIAVENLYEFIENHIRNVVENKLLKPDEKNQCLVYIPKHLTTFVKQQLNKWILSAWQAKFAYHENIDYLITNGKDGVQSIVPIDYRNTGIVQMNTSWPDGLHQFLQIKHKLRISAESLTTNFLSNVAFFSRYGKNLFGLTGTLGSKEAKDLIRYIYNVDFVIIPPYKYTQFIAYLDKLSQSEQDWVNECTESIYTEAKINQRAVLVICETKSDASKIYEKLIETHVQLKRQIKLYTRSDNEEQNAINNELDCGQIIVATNLAGRGTDIGTTHKVEENGGLHVLVTFLPLNTRVEHQAFGRTSRQGKRGSAQLIVLTPVNSQTKYDNIIQLKEDRDKQEKRHIARAKRVELNHIKRRDRLFGKFCDLRTELRRRENDTYKLNCVEESWGFWLKTTFSNEDSVDDDNNDDLNDQLVNTKFEEFRSKILADYNSNMIFQNPFYLILKANEYIFEKKKYEEAIDFLQHAIESDPIFTSSARYNLAYALIKISSDNKEKAKSELEKALNTIDNILIPQHETMSISFRIASGNNNDTENMKDAASDTSMKSDAEDQIMNRINLLCLCKNQIEQAILVIDNALSKEHNVRMQYKALDEFFSDVNKPALDIIEFKESGFLGFFQLTQKEPTPWLSIIAVGLLGIAQAVVGAALIVFTAGAAIQIGTMLLSEGIGDMITAIKSAIIDEFSWEEYAIQKAISIAITIATCGMPALKETGQGIKSGLKGCVNIVKSTAVGGKELVGQFTKEGWVLVGKQIGQAFVKAGTKEILKTVLDKTILAQLSKRINEEISEHIQERVNNEIKDNQIIKEFLTVDAALRRTNTCHNEVENLLNRILHPQSNRFVDAAISIVKSIINQLTNGVSAHILKIFTAGKCVTDLVTFLDEVFIEFRRDLVKLRDKLKIDHLLHKNNQNNIDERTAKEIVEQLKREKYIEKDHIKIIKQLDPSPIALKEHKKHETYVVQVCNDIYIETTNRSEYAFEKNMITRTVNDHLANYMTNRLNAELIKPAVHTSVDAGVNHLSKKIEAACAGSKGTLEEQLKNRRAQNDIIRHGKDMMKRAAKSIRKDNVQDGIPIHPDIENMAKNVENGAPGDLKDILAISARLRRPVQIFRNGAYDITIGDMNGSEPLKLNFEESNTGDIGHYTSNDAGTVVIPSGPTNCLYDAISEQTNIPSDNLRQYVADHMRHNTDYYRKMMPAYEMLAQNQNKGLLYVGGANKNNNLSSNPAQNKIEIISHENRRLTKAEGKLKEITEKFIQSFNIDQFGEGEHLNATTMFGYNKKRQFTSGYFTGDDRQLFFDSLDKKEEKLVTSTATLRLDHQGKTSGRLNLQIQYENKSYANVIFPTGYQIGKDKLKELFRESLSKQQTIEVIPQRVPPGQTMMSLFVLIWY
ncbi:unnamed protein product [Rotaria sp. Silwood1]|nr:unnamed protein product [Rotaria sp. Silwood1]